jgi:endonuclease YncB( thermonuclease family)
MAGQGQKPFNALPTGSLFVTIICFIILFFPALSIAGQLKVVRVIDGDPIKLMNDGKSSTIRLVGINAPEKPKKKNEPDQPFIQRSTKYLAGLIFK